MQTIRLDRSTHLLLLGHLQDAEDDHDQARRDSLQGVTAEALEADKALWSMVGETLGALARFISCACARSALGERRPQPEPLVARLSESIDDQLDREAWLVVDAAARLRAATP